MAGDAVQYLVCDALRLADLQRMDTSADTPAHGIKTSHNLCLSCGHSIDAHDRQYGCAEDGCDCETPNA